MKVAPVSADLLIELTVAALAVGALVYAGKRATTAVSGALTGALDTIAAAPGRAAAAVGAAASQATLGGAWSDPSKYFGSLDSDQWAGGGNFGTPAPAPAAPGAITPGQVTPSLSLSSGWDNPAQFFQ